MKKPANVTGPIETVRWMSGQAWSDLKSVYYANTPVWRWLKSGALVFLGLCVWTGASVVFSIRPEWTVLLYVMAYGFLLVLWGPLTHFAIVPAVLRLRRTASHPITRTISRHGGKINLTIFFALVVVLAVVQPGIMMLEFAPVTDGNGEDVRGDVDCDRADELIICDIENPAGFDHVVILTEDGVIERADEAPYQLEFQRDAVDGDRFRVQFRDEDGQPLRTVLWTIPAD